MFTSIVSSFVALVVVAPATFGIQDAPDKQQISKLDFLVGKWEGEGWQSVGQGERVEFKGTEVVQLKLSGGALLVEGEFFSKEDGKLIHQTLGVVTYRPSRSAFNLRAYLFNRPEGDYKLEAQDKGFTWSIELDHGAIIRYTMTLKEDGTWNEVGTYAMDGMEPVQILEMNLRKVSSDTSAK